LAKDIRSKDGEVALNFLRLWPSDKALETEKQKLREYEHLLRLPVPRARARIRSLPVRLPERFHHPEDCGGLECHGDPDLGFPDPTCPMEEYYKSRERLKRLKMEPLLTLLFQNPKMTVYNKLENAELVYSSK
jgi:hypothetical protein